MSGAGPYRVAVVGATGAVGSTMLAILRERGFPASEIVAFASGRSTGREWRACRGKDDGRNVRRVFCNLRGCESGQRDERKE